MPDDQKKGLKSCGMVRVVLKSSAKRKYGEKNFIKMGVEAATHFWLTKLYLKIGEILWVKDASILLGILTANSISKTFSKDIWFGISIHWGMV